MLILLHRIVRPDFMGLGRYGTMGYVMVPSMAYEIDSRSKEFISFKTQFNVSISIKMLSIYALL